MVYLESIAGAVAAPSRTEVDERAARRTLRAQIARLERELASAVIAAYPRLPAGGARVSHAGPRLLGLGELERIRDDLADRLAEVREQAARQGERQAEARLLIERMLLDPGALQVGAGEQRGHRRAGLQELARRSRGSASSACWPAGGTSRSPPAAR